MRRTHFSVTPTTSKRIHYVDRTDVEVVLSRLPDELWRRLRGVHFNDRSIGFRRLGYVNERRTDISLCALPERLGLSACCRWHDLTPAEFGAEWGAKSPVLAVRRFMLYNVFLHELGHLQVFDLRRPSRRLRFNVEKCAQEFANDWRRRLWSEHFEHPDPVHNPPAAAEFAAGPRYNSTSPAFSPK